jgi:hypothetical protein
MYTKGQKKWDAKQRAHDIGAYNGCDGGLHATPLSVPLRMRHRDVSPHGQSHGQPDAYCVAYLGTKHGFIIYHDVAILGTKDYPLAYFKSSVTRDKFGWKEIFLVISWKRQQRKII